MIPGKNFHRVLIIMPQPVNFNISGIHNPPLIYCYDDYLLNIANDINIEKVFSIFCSMVYK